MKRILIFIYFILNISNINSQQSDILTINKICNLNSYTNGDIVLENSEPINENDYLYSYLSKILNIFNLPINSTYNIRRSSFDNVAGSLFLRQDNAIIPTIVINDNYFLSKIKNIKKLQ